MSLPRRAKTLAIAALSFLTLPLTARPGHAQTNAQAPLPAMQAGAAADPQQSKFDFSKAFPIDQAITAPNIDANFVANAIMAAYQDFKQRMPDIAQQNRWIVDARDGSDEFIWVGKQKYRPMPEDGNYSKPAFQAVDAHGQDIPDKTLSQRQLDALQTATGGGYFRIQFTGKFSNSVESVHPNDDIALLLAILNVHSRTYDQVASDLKDKNAKRDAKDRLSAADLVRETRKDWQALLGSALALLNNSAELNSALSSSNPMDSLLELAYPRKADNSPRILKSPEDMFEVIHTIFGIFPTRSHIVIPDHMTFTVGYAIPPDPNQPSDPETVLIKPEPSYHQEISMKFKLDNLPGGAEMLDRYLRRCRQDHQAPDYVRSAVDCLGSLARTYNTLEPDDTEITESSDYIPETVDWSIPDVLLSSAEFAALGAGNISDAAAQEIQAAKAQIIDNHWGAIQRDLVDDFSYWPHPQSAAHTTEQQEPDSDAITFFFSQYYYPGLQSGYLAIPERTYPAKMTSADDRPRLIPPKPDDAPKSTAPTAASPAP